MGLPYFVSPHTLVNFGLLYFALSLSLFLSLLFLVSLNSSISLSALAFARMNRVSKDGRLS